MFPDDVFIREKPVRYMGIPHQILCMAHLCAIILIPPSVRRQKALLPYQTFPTPRPNCSLGYIYTLPFRPTFLIICKKLSAMVDGKVRYFLYGDTPTAVEIARIVVPPKQTEWSREIGRFEAHFSRVTCSRRIRYL